MFHESSTPPETTTELSNDEFKCFIQDFQALLWRIEIAQSRITFFNEYVISELGNETSLFIKNPAFRKRLLVPQDQPLLDSFFEAIKEKRNASVVFRIVGKSGNIIWLKLAGGVSSSNPEYYHGALIEVTDTALKVFNTAEKEIAPTVRIEETDHPVLLANAVSGTILKGNASMLNLLAQNAINLSQTTLESLFSSRLVSAIKASIHNVPVAQNWCEKLELQLDTATITTRAELKCFEYMGEKLVRIALHDPEIVARQSQQHKTNAVFSAEQNVQDVPSIDSIMQAAFDQPAFDRKHEAILFSDVHARKNKVMVYVAGTLFKDYAQGGIHPFKGTIAEHIEQFKLKHVVVNDTLDSIKPIDWALFVPCGIRSYYAKPYYFRGILRSVLIVCSSKPGRYATKNSTSYDDVFDQLADALKSWRQHQR